MFYNYKILEVNHEETLYLYINSMYEFSNEFDNKNKTKSIINKINKYIKDMDIKFNGKKVMLVVNGLIVGSIVLITNNFGNIGKNIEHEYISYNETMDLDKNDNVDIIDIEKDIKTYLKDEIQHENETYIISNFVKMKNKEGRITYIDLNNYITSRLSEIIPPTYEEEAIKSAAVVVRTIALQELYEKNYLDENSYRTNISLKKMWGKNFYRYFNKLKNAVEDTSYQYLINNQYFFNFDTRSKYQVPFSNYGANKLAKLGYKYTDILGHYYPDAELVF